MQRHQLQFLNFHLIKALRVLYFCQMFWKLNEIKEIWGDLVILCSSAEFKCNKINITLSIDQMCDGNNDCPGLDEYPSTCTEDEDNNTNQTASEYMEN